MAIRTWLGAAVVAGVAMTAGLQPARAADGGTLVYIVQPEPPTLASFLSTSGPIGQVAAKIYDGLLEYDLDLNPIPGLAESFEVSEDGLTMTFKLREGVQWHDGEPFTSADVQFSVMEVLKTVHPRGASTFKEVNAVETPDEHTAIFHLDKPAPYMIRALSGYESPMVPRHLLEGTDLRSSDLATNPVGTGAWKFVEWKKGQYVRLDRNENYWKEGLPHLDRLVARFIPDASTRAAAIENGEAMYAAFSAVPNVDVLRIRDMDGFGVTTDGYSMINPMALLEIDTTQPPFDDARVRRAISLAIDRTFIIENVWFGFGKPATSALSSNFAPTGLYAEGMPTYQPTADLDAAKALLEEAGIDPSETWASVPHDIIPYGEEWRRLGEYLKQALSQIGIALELRYEDVPTWLKRVYSDYDFKLNSNFFYQLSDPVLGVHRQYASDQIRQGTVFVNSGRYSNPELDEILAAATIEADAGRRAELYAEAQAILAEEMPVINLFEIEFVTVFSDKVKDHTTSPLGVYGPWDRIRIED